MIMPCGILFLICFNEVLWSKRNTWPLWCIAALNFIVTIGFIRHARQVRKGRLNNLPLHLGFSATDDRALKASSGSEMAWKIIFHTEFQAQYFNGNVRICDGNFRMLNTHPFLRSFSYRPEEMEASHSLHIPWRTFAIF